MVLHYDVYFALILKGLLYCDEQLHQAYFLYQFALQHIEFFYFSLVDYFHRVLFHGLLLLGQHNIPEGAPPQVLDRLVVFGAMLHQAYLLCRLRRFVFSGDTLGVGVALLFTCSLRLALRVVFIAAKVTHIY